MSSAEDLFAEIVLASKPTNGALPLITMHMYYPDIIHGEVMTHRKFSRNARSTRAVPVATMVKEVREKPFVPWHWGKNQKGMQASEECNELVAVNCEEYGPNAHRFMNREDAWRDEAAHAATKAESYASAGYHKQIANRIIAPYTWKHTLITSTSWANFLHLRDHEDAEPHFHDLAAAVRKALRNVEYQTVEPGQWHLPYINGDDWNEIICKRNVAPKERLFVAQKLSVARSARISYAPFDGDASIERELERYDLLVGSSPLHASPTEHQATPDEEMEVFYGEDIDSGPSFAKVEKRWRNEKLSGNFAPGWIQFRKTLAGEYIDDTALAA